MKTSSRRGIGVMVALLAILATACGGVSREDAIDELVGLGISRDTAQCIMDDLESQGYEASDLTGNTLTPEVEASLETAVGSCLTASELGGLATGAEAETVRSSFIESLIAGTNGEITQAEAECMFDEVMTSLDDRGVALFDLEQDESFAAEVQAALANCR